MGFCCLSNWRNFLLFLMSWVFSSRNSIVFFKYFCILRWSCDFPKKYAYSDHFLTPSQLLFGSNYSHLYMRYNIILLNGLPVFSCPTTYFSNHIHQLSKTQITCHSFAPNFQWLPISPRVKSKFPTVTRRTLHILPLSFSCVISYNSSLLKHCFTNIFVALLFRSQLLGI